MIQGTWVYEKYGNDVRVYTKEKKPQVGDKFERQQNNVGIPHTSPNRVISNGAHWCNHSNVSRTGTAELRYKIPFNTNDEILKNQKYTSTICSYRIRNLSAKRFSLLL